MKLSREREVADGKSRSKRVNTRTRRLWSSRDEPSETLSIEAMDVGELCPRSDRYAFRRTPGVLLRPQGQLQGILLFSLGVSIPVILSTPVCYTTAVARFKHGFDLRLMLIFSSTEVTRWLYHLSP